MAHVARLYRHLLSALGDGDFEIEVSVDETESPRTHAQHVYIATELRRLGVNWVSLAPRYVGRFERGVDYIGDVAEFEEDVGVHAAIARTISPDGPYKLSLHSGLHGRLFGLLREHPEAYAADLERHFLRRLEPFAQGGTA